MSVYLSAGCSESIMGGGNWLSKIPGLRLETEVRKYEASYIEASPVSAANCLGTGTSIGLTRFGTKSGGFHSPI